jgi:hypothetical protein
MKFCDFRFFSWISFPEALEYPVMADSNFFQKICEDIRSSMCTFVVNSTSDKWKNQKSCRYFNSMWINFFFMFTLRCKQSDIVTIICHLCQRHRCYQLQIYSRWDWCRWQICHCIYRYQWCTLVHSPFCWSKVFCSDRIFTVYKVYPVKGINFLRLKFRGCYFMMATIVVTFARTFPALPEIGETTTNMNSWC